MTLRELDDPSRSVERSALERRLVATAAAIDSAVLIVEREGHGFAMCDKRSRTVFGRW